MTVLHATYMSVECDGFKMHQLPDAPNSLIFVYFMFYKECAETHIRLSPSRVTEESG